MFQVGLGELNAGAGDDVRRACSARSASAGTGSRRCAGCAWRPRGSCAPRRRRARSSTSAPTRHDASALCARPSMLTSGATPVSSGTPRARPSASRASRSDSSPLTSVARAFAAFCSARTTSSPLAAPSACLRRVISSCSSATLQADAVDLGAALGRHDGDDLVGEAERERALLVVDREARRRPR